MYFALRGLLTQYMHKTTGFIIETGRADQSTDHAVSNCEAFVGYCCVDIKQLLGIVYAVILDNFKVHEVAADRRQNDNVGEIRFSAGR